MTVKTNMEEIENLGKGQEGKWTITTDKFEVYQYLVECIRTLQGDRSGVKVHFNGTGKQMISKMRGFWLGAPVAP